MTAAFQPRPPGAVLGGAAALGLVCSVLLCYVAWPASGKELAWPWRRGGGDAAGSGGGLGTSGIVTPHPRSFGNGTVYDFVLTGDVQRDDNVTVYFSGPAALRWHWTTFYCSFQVPGRGQRTAVSEGTLTFWPSEKGVRQVQCPLPPPVLEVVRRRKPQKLRFSVYGNLKARDNIIENVVVPLPAEPGRKFRVVMQTMLKDEADALMEWIEYHALLGVEHFYVYDNLSGDDLQRRLRRHRCAGLVTLIQWPFLSDIRTPANGNEWYWGLVQRASWNHYLKAYGRHTEWVSFADVDEYFQLNETYAAALEAGTATLVDVLDAEAQTATEDGSAPIGLRLDMYQIMCNLKMNDVRHARYKLLIEMCDQINPAELEQEDMRLGRSKIFARAAAVPGMLVPHHLEGRQPTRVVSWPDIGRFRHYRGYGDKNPLEFDGITDDSMQRYVERLRAALIRYDK